MNVLDNESSSMYFPNGTLLVRLTYTRLHLAIDSTVTVSYRRPLSHHRLIGLCNIALIQKHIYLELYNHEICPIIDDNAMTRERGLTLTLNQLTLGVSPLTFSNKPVVHCYRAYVCHVNDYIHATELYTGWYLLSGMQFSVLRLYKPNRSDRCLRISNESLSIKIEL